MQVVWTAKALRDLAVLRSYISQDKPPAAERQVELILAAVTGLARFPHSGRPGRRAGTRELVVGQTPYLVPYRVRGDLVEVLRVLQRAAALAGRALNL
jgi:toxin ParE1/3/4